ncbi:AraC family transcriptional regulator [Paenibacillus sp. BIHB 4019]|uniref:AraC family transcriptional regulator n=1 Tax=Paenibacillus sp. BIHB 4019 TaxID=1870819 RepID=A0A1B2DHJ3_9BACL|nr:AraC family transcriptional regulator [Paenibacillus sp. BIHB 4019]ANY67166.1 AraC family transcriptional regulator [Paenibacillus sp. BIHB 4019]
MPEAIHNQQIELAKLIEQHSGQDGVHETAVPSLYLIRLSCITEPVHRVYKPSLCFIAQGLKEVMLAQELFEYGPSDYLISSMNLPVIGHVIKAFPDAPYLSLRLEFTPNQILEVLKDAPFQITPQENTKRAMFVGDMDSSILDSLIRLTRLLNHPKDISFLAPIYTKEILYLLLQGQFGVTLAQLAMEGSSTYRISEAIEHITHNVGQPLRIEELAELANMGISTFHRHFKEVTAMSPIQFQKQMRLQEARRLLLSESGDAADVAFRVGYESASQFSREYSRMFGAPPKADIMHLKAKYGQS